MDADPDAGDRHADPLRDRVVADALELAREQDLPVDRRERRERAPQQIHVLVPLLLARRDGRSATGTSGRRRRTRSMAALTAIVRTHAVNDDWWR